MNQTILRADNLRARVGMFSQKLSFRKNKSNNLFQCLLGLLMPFIRTPRKRVGQTQCSLTQLVFTKSLEQVRLNTGSFFIQFNLVKPALKELRKQGFRASEYLNSSTNYELSQGAMTEKSSKLMYYQSKEGGESTEYKEN